MLIHIKNIINIQNKTVIKTIFKILLYKIEPPKVAFLP